jgi:hypothetical protein
MTGATPVGPPGEADPLAALRDWHLPEPVPWWPPAPGWWLVAGLALLLGSLALFRWWVRWRRTAPARAALAELKALRALLVPGVDDRRFAARVAALLRRLALARYPRPQVAGLAGRHWLEFLDRTGEAGAFTRGPGRLLAEIPYRRYSPPVGGALQTEAGPRRYDGPERPDDLAELAALAERWIRAHWEPRS